MKNVAIVAPSGNIDDKEKLFKLKDFFKNFDIECKIFPSCTKNFRYMAGNDTERLNDLHSAFLDPEIDTIICARGGYGAIRILDKIDYDIIKNNPKKFVGSSDITALLLAVYKHTGQITHHAKMAVNGVLNMEKEEFLNYKNKIENNIYTPPKFTFPKSFTKPLAKDGQAFSPLKTTKSILWGGNLATITSLFGAPPETYVPKTPITLFIEDINEPDYKIDRMLTQILRNKPLKEKINAVIFGEFIGAGKYLDEILEEFAERLDVPYAHDLNITHGESNTVVPIGLKIKLEQ